MQTDPQRKRWRVVGLIFLASCLTYSDRQMFGLLKPIMTDDLGWSEIDYSRIVVAYHVAFIAGFLVFGPLVDRLGARRGYAAAFSVWAAAHTCLGLAGNVIQFSLVRFFVGAGESGSFTARLKAISEWFRPGERALAIGIYNAAASAGAVLTLVSAPVLLASFGWRGVFVISGLASFLWLALWLAVYRSPAATAAAPPQDGETADGVSFATVLGQSRTWAYAGVKFLTVPVWWLYLFWLPDFLHRAHNLDMGVLGVPMLLIFVMGDLGSVSGGWMSSRLIARGMPVGRARKAVMAGCAALIMPVSLAPFSGNVWVTVGLIAIAAAAHQAFSANLLAVPSDLFPRAQVGRVVGVGGAAGALGATLMALGSGLVLERTGSYAAIFAVAGVVYLFAVTLLHLSKAYASPTPEGKPQAAGAS